MIHILSSSEEINNLPPNDAKMSEEAESLARRNVELLVQRNRQDAGIGHVQGETGVVRSVGIVGAGMMGTAVAAACVKQNLPVVITDADDAALAKAADRIVAELCQQSESDKRDVHRRVGWLVEQTSDVVKVAQCELVLESVAEDAAVKQQVYARIVGELGPETVLASNTSTIPISRLAAGVDDPGRFCGIHFFHPVRHRSLVEVVRGSQTNDRTITAALSFAKQIDKLPIVVGDGPGFLVNRLLVPYLNEALEMLLEGATVDQIDAAATDFGMAMGPLRILDEIGLDTALLAGRVLWEAFPDRIVASPLLITMLKQGRLGRKSGSGFYAYDEETPWDGPGKPNPGIDQIISQWARPPRQVTTEEITSRLILPMVLEATRLLEDQTVRDPRDVDLSVLFGLGFPASRGGLLYWADTLGANRIIRMLKPLEPLGERVQATPLLLEMAQSGRRFHDLTPVDGSGK